MDYGSKIMEEVREEAKTKEQGGEKRGKKKSQIVEISEMLGDLYKFRFNMMSYEVEVWDVKQQKYLPMDDALLSKILYNFWIDGFTVGDKTLLTIIKGSLAKPYHPVEEFFTGLRWDGTQRIKQLAKTLQIEEMIAGVNMQQLFEKYLTKWLVAAAAQATGKGVNHTCLVLSGAQGKGKTTWLENLCPSVLADFIYSGHIRSDDKDNLSLLPEKFIINIDDQLDMIRDLKWLKSLFTTKSITVRKAFHRFAPTRPRLASFVASVNTTQFLQEDQNRRYLVFPVLNINYQNKVDMVQVWAEAVHLLKQGFRYWFDQEETKQLNQINQSFRNPSHEEELLIKFFRLPTHADQDPEIMMQSEIKDYLAARSASSKISGRALSEALQALGYERKPVRTNMGPRRAYTLVKLDETLATAPVRIKEDCKDSDLPF